MSSRHPLGPHRKSWTENWWKTVYTFDCYWIISYEFCLVFWSKYPPPGILWWCSHIYCILEIYNQWARECAGGFTALMHLPLIQACSQQPLTICQQNQGAGCGERAAEKLHTSPKIWHGLHTQTHTSWQGGEGTPLPQSDKQFTQPLWGSCRVYTLVLWKAS